MSAVKISFVTNICNHDPARGPQIIYKENVGYRRDLPPGSATWINNAQDEPAALWFTCPCGCGQVTAITVKSGHGGTAWNWDGNKELPTCNPSILLMQGCRWHGYLTRGLFGKTQNPETE